MRLKDKVAIVTGSGQGIGKCLAKRLATEGAKIVIADINEENGRIVEQQFTEQGYPAIFVKLDVASKESVNNMVEQAVNKFGTIDILVNNAAIFSTIKLKPFEEISLEEWNSVMNVNLTGVFLCSQAVVPVMRKQQFGRIVNISSGVIFSGKPHYIHYVSSKAGVAGFTRALAREVGNDYITVNTIAPGQTNTDVDRETVTEEQRANILKQRCIPRRQTPADLEGAVAFLCSDDASFMTGQLMLIDGGRGMH